MRKVNFGTTIVVKSYLLLFFGIILFSGMVVLKPFSITTIFLVSIIAVFFCSILMYSKNFFNPFIFFFIFSFLGFIDVTLVAAGVRNSLTLVPDYVYTKTLLIMLIWFLTFSVGYGFVFKISLKKEFSNKANSIQGADINPQIIFLMCGFIFAYSITSTLKTSIKLGGLIQGMSGGGGAFADQGYLLALLGFAGCLPVMTLYRGKKFQAILYALMVFIGIIMTGRRSMAILTAFIPFLIYWNAKVKRIKLSQIAIIAIPLLFIILFIGAIRTAENPNFSQTNTDNFYLSQLSILARYNGYGDNIPALVYKLDSGELNFQGYKYAVTGLEYFIPRSLWPNKPKVHSAEIVSNNVFFIGDTGRPTGPYGWAYFNLGFLGVILSGLFTGIIAGNFYRIVQRKKSVILLCMYGLLILPVLEVFQPESQMKIVLFAVTIKILEMLSRRTKINTEKIAFIRSTRM
ncbi:O-antigen polymerase [Fictibacillus fluitans]|uniref:O-antigen polymerase n=1 Tax=Fictibacillus fluitans TaxID=3058422 RepID=A0ABT8HT52_9BACL|nr:O-antigen polymerase [Fictibacillus sp. NE201]MDN4523949.1 O-antigen polymerase [Fictibacillus sp. NE201]